MPQDTEGCAEFEQEPILLSFSDHCDLKEFERDRTISPLPQDTDDTVAFFKEFDRDKTISPLPHDTEDTVALFKEFDRDKTISPLPQDREDTVALFKEFNKIKLYLPCHRIEKVLLLPLRNLNGKNSATITCS